MNGGKRDYTACYNSLKIRLSIILSLLCLCHSTALAQYSGGSGTPEDPYRIATAQDLIDLGQTKDDYAKSFILTAHIDLAGRVFERAVIAPNIGGYDMEFGINIIRVFGGMEFSGRFDGQGHVIRNLCVDEPTIDFQGLFGKLSNGAEITNLGLDNVQISGRDYVGALVGDIGYIIPDAIPISSCYSSGTVTGEENVGGLVGRNNGTILSSYSACMVSGASYVGGLVGFNTRGTISSSHSTGRVYGTSTVGGLVGLNLRATILSSRSSAMVSGEERIIGGLVGNNNEGTVVSSYSTGMVSGEHFVGGLVGDNYMGTISSSHSSGRVYGSNRVGGLVGYYYSQRGHISSSYSSARVHGTWQVGGLLGYIGGGPGHISSSYSTGRVYGVQDAGGLVGHTYDGSSAWKVFTGTISSSFWDVESSEQTESIGGTGLSTEQMQDSSTYLGADWDFMDESANGGEDIWWMPQGDTPRLWWQYGYAYRPSPMDNASTPMRELTLQWRSGGPGIEHDLYFGDDEVIVADANTASGNIFLGRLPADTLSYDLPSLESGKTYYWRVDGVNDTNPAAVWKGPVWRFTITDFVMVKMLEDFESYDDLCNRIFFTWQDGWGHSGGENAEGCDMASYAGNGSAAMVGNADPPYASHVLVRDASQSLPVYYDNASQPWFSELERTWPTAQDWTADDADALTLYFKGEAENIQDRLYMAFEDSRGRIAVVYHSNTSAVLSTEAQVWHIPLADLDAAGVDLSAVERLVIGVGNRDNPQASGSGMLYIDDIQLTKRGH